MKPLAKIIVKETAGIRRFLYPIGVVVQTGINGRSLYGIDIQAPSRSGSWRVADADGRLLPSFSRPIDIRPSSTGQTSTEPGALIYDIGPGPTPPQWVDFALSLAPFEELELVLMETEKVPALPDPLRLTFDALGGLTSRQERVSFHIGVKTGLDFVVYDEAEHLAGPLSFSVDSEEVDEPTSITQHGPDDLGLSAWIAVGHETAGVGYRFTGCKSWVTVSYGTERPLAGKQLVFSLPLNVSDEVPICDFGVGDGVYEKIAGDLVMWTTEFGERSYAKWRISTVNVGVERIDYQGEYATSADFVGCAWFHWIEKTKALAVAIPGIHHHCRQMTVTLSRDGKVDIAFTMSASAPAGAHFPVCYHFLNDIPAIAAATNPASILLPPEVSIAPLD